MVNPFPCLRFCCTLQICAIIITSTFSASAAPQGPLLTADDLVVLSGAYEVVTENKEYDVGNGAAEIEPSKSNPQCTLAHDHEDEDETSIPYHWTTFETIIQVFAIVICVGLAFILIVLDIFDDAEDKLSSLSSIPDAAAAINVDTSDDNAQLVTSEGDDLSLTDVLTGETTSARALAAEANRNPRVMVITVIHNDKSDSFIRPLNI